MRSFFHSLTIGFAQNKHILTENNILSWLERFLVQQSGEGELTIEKSPTDVVHLYLKTIALKRPFSWIFTLKLESTDRV